MVPSLDRDEEGNRMTHDRAEGWTPERIERLKQLRAESKSFTEIGRELGISRNAISGKVWRLGLAKKKITQLRHWRS